MPDQPTSHRRTLAMAALSVLVVLAMAGVTPFLGHRDPAATPSMPRLVSALGVHRHDFEAGGAHPLRVDAYWNARELADSAVRSRPWIAYVHGGGWGYGAVDEPTAVRLCERMVALGLTCFSLDYPLLPAAWPAQEAQVARELVWVRRHGDGFHLDPRLGFAAGHSAGALMAGVAGLHDGHLAGIVSMAGATNVPYVATHGPDRFVSRLARALVRDQPLNSPLARSAEVISHVGRHTRRVPYLLVHESGDPAVGVGTSRLLAAQLRQRGFPVTLRVFPGHTHQVNVAGPAVQAVDTWLENRIAAVRSRSSTAS